MDAVYARVQDGDMGEVRCRVTLRTLLYRAAAFPASHLLSRVWELSLLAVRTQAAVRAVKEGILLPPHDAVVEEQLAYAV